MNSPLPQLDRLFLAGCGLETDLIYNLGIDLPCFSTLPLVRTEQGRAALEAYHRSVLELARRVGTACVIESATWRASPDWAPKLGLSLDELDDLNRAAVEMLKPLRDEYQTESTPVIIDGCIGPRGDGYDPGAIMSVAEAEVYHGHQVSVLASAAPDLLTGMTMTNIPEAIGIVRAARAAGLPVVISFTVETDGRLPTGDALRVAIESVDDATGGYPAYFMINCAHPTHFAHVLDEGGEWTRRVRGIRANASRCSHAELDAMTELDTGDPAELAQLYARIRDRHPQIIVLGGCCGTDLRHIAAIAQACTESRVAA